MTQFEKYCEIYHWVAKQYSKDTIERLADLIELLRPTEGTINTIYSITSEKPTEQEFLDKLHEETEEGKEFNDPNKRFSKDDTIFDDFADEEVMFTADGDIAFDGFGADAQRTIDVKEMVQEQGAEHAVYTLYNAALEMVFEVAAVSVSIK